MANQTQRHFLGWDGPALPRAAAWLLDRACGAGGGADEADLSDLFVVLPVARARRLLTGLLVDEAEEQGVSLTPPTLLTPGELPAALLGPPLGAASPVLRRLAWIESLREMDSQTLALALPQPPGADDLPGFSRLAGTLERVSDDLASVGLRFLHVADRVDEIAPIEEASRWRTLALVQDGAVRRLAKRGLVDEALALSDAVFDGSTAASTTASTPAPTGESSIVLVGVAEMNRVERAALQRSACDVDVLVVAPKSKAALFDELGCVNVEAWTQTPVELADERVIFAADPGEQVERALLELAGPSAPTDVGEVVIGVVDHNLLPALRRRASLAANLTLRSARGEPILSTVPGRLLTLLRDSLQEPTFDTLGALVRHPDVEAALLNKLQSTAAESADGSTGEAAQQDEIAEDWLAMLDEIRHEYVATDPASAPASLGPEAAQALRLIREGVDDLLGDLTRTKDGARPLCDWAEAIESAFRAIYEARSLKPEVEADRRLIAGLSAIRQSLEELSETAQWANQKDSGALPVASAWQALAFVQERLERDSVPDPAGRDAIETLGWLDLALDPAQRCVVVGMAETHVPQSFTHDALIPGALRTVLGLSTNEARLARDAYLVTTINASRDAIFLTSRQGDQGDPQTPSRLLFRTTGVVLAQRVRRFTHPQLEPAPRRRLSSRVTPGGKDCFSPKVVAAPGYTPPPSMRVTDFDAYLRSPVGWYLERHLGLKELDEPPRELTPMLFGSLAHGALEAFGRDPHARNLDDPEELAEALSDFLNDTAHRMFGPQPTLAVRLQIELLRRRLSLFAPEQAKRRRDGWSIQYVEWSPGCEDTNAAIEVDDKPMRLRGKIDRIDVHEEGRWAIIDYKTGGAEKAAKACRKRDGAWLRLQLPLYRHLAQSLDPPGAVELGYAGLPADEAEGAWSFLDVTTSDLANADVAACDVVRRIRNLEAGQTIEPGDHPPKAGALGFVTGQRFDLGGRAEVDEVDAEQEVLS